MSRHCERSEAVVILNTSRALNGQIQKAWIATLP